MYTKKTLFVFWILNLIDDASQYLYDAFGSKIIIKKATQLYNFVEQFRGDLPARNF